MIALCQCGSAGACSLFRQASSVLSLQHGFEALICWPMCVQSTSAHREYAKIRTCKHENFSSVCECACNAQLHTRKLLIGFMLIRFDSCVCGSGGSDFSAGRAHQGTAEALASPTFRLACLRASSHIATEQTTEEIKPKQVLCT